MLFVIAIKKRMVLIIPCVLFIDYVIDFLYGKWETVVKEDIYEKIKEYTKWSVSDLKKEYDVLTQMESQTEFALKDINEKYPKVVKEESIDKVIEGLRRRKGR